ncbi:MAG: hypothetical protein EPO06_10575 [Burkholderiaceae bacterium]|nr:MAG: hypothetical protein EPO06_10575 [Burkholderiaceae bacterium]
MAHRRFEFDMPAPVEVVFDAFHYHHWRARWDSLVNATHVLGGAPCPFVGAITENAGGGMLRGLSMRTQFVSYDRPRVAAASMLGRSFPFMQWAASMQHKPIGPRSSIMIYTYTFQTGPTTLRWLIEPITQWIFDWQTRRRFERMRAFLARHVQDVEQWQRTQ